MRSHKQKLRFSKVAPFSKKISSFLRNANVLSFVHGNVKSTAGMNLVIIVFIRKVFGSKEFLRCLAIKSSTNDAFMLLAPQSHAAFLMFNFGPFCTVILW